MSIDDRACRRLRAAPVAAGTCSSADPLRHCNPAVQPCTARFAPWLAAAVPALTCVRVSEFRGAANAGRNSNQTLADSRASDETR